MAASRAGSATRSLSSDSQLIQDYLLSAGILVNPTNAGAGQVATFLNAEGQAEAIVIDPNGDPYHVCREPLSDSGWNMYGVGSGFQAVAAVNAATLWAWGNDGSLWRSDHGRWTETQTLPSGNLAAGVSAGMDGTIWALDASQTLFVKGKAASQTAPSANPAISPVFLLDSANLLNVFCIDTDGVAWTIRQTAPGGGWNAWINLATPTELELTSIAVGANPDGRLQVFAIGSDATVYTAWQQVVGGNWSGWGFVSDSNPAIAQLVAGQNADGRLQVWALSTPDDTGNVSLYTNYQTDPDYAWHGWWNWGTPTSESPSCLTLLLDPTGCLQLILGYSTPFTPSQLIKQTGPNQSWTPWQAISIPTTGVSSATLIANQDGHLEMFAIGNDGAIWHAWEEGGAWSQYWSSLGSLGAYLPFTALAVGRNADGRLEVFAQAAGAVYHIWQTAPNNGWSAWAGLSSPSDQTISTVAVALDQLGSLEVIGVANNNALWQTYYSSSAGNWQGWITNWWLWSRVPNPPNLTGMPSGVDGAFWAVASTAVVRLAGGAWTTTPLPNGLQPACLAVDVEGAAWVLANDSQGEFFRNTGDGFEQMPGLLPGANSIAASSASCIWATAAASQNEYALFSYGNGGWQAASTPQINNMDWNNLPAVSVGRDDSVWMLDGSGNAWKQQITFPTWRWNIFPAPSGLQLNFLSAARGGGAWGIDTTGTIWQFKGSWTRFKHPLPGASITQISGGVAGSLWAIDADGVPYLYSSASSWGSVAQQFDGPLVQSPVSWAIQTDMAYEYVLQIGEGSGSWVPLASWDDYVAQQISVGTDGTALLIDTSGALHGVTAPHPAIDSAPSLVQIAVVDTTRIWGIGQDGSGFALHLYAEGQWQSVDTSGTLFTGTAEPQLSSAGDGTVWLLDTNSAPRRLSWSPRKADWQHKDKSFLVQSVAAANVNDSSLTTAYPHEAWAISSNGAFRRNYGTGWTDAYASLPNGVAPAQVSVGPDGAIWALNTQGGLYRRQAWTQPPILGSGVGAISASQNGGGVLSLFTIDANNQVWVTSEQTGETGWLPWLSLSAPEPLALILSGVDQSGLPSVFCLSTSGIVYQAQQPPGTASEWPALTPLGGTGQPTNISLSGLALGQDQSQSLYVFGVGTEGNVWVIQQQTAGWSDWTALPAISSGPPVALMAGQDPDGTLEIFILDSANSLQHSWQDSSGWSSWEMLGAAGQPSPVGLTGFTTGSQQGGPLFVFGIGADGAVYAINSENSSPDGWSQWSSLGGVGGVRPLLLATGTASDGAFLVLMQGSDGGIYSASLPPEESAWSGWGPLGSVGAQGSPFQGLALGVGENGSLRVFSAGGGSLWQTGLLANTLTGWGDWGRLSGPQFWQPCGAQRFAQVPVGNAANLWTVFSDGSVQTSADGVSWTLSPFPGSGSSAVALSVSVGTDGTPWAVTATECYHYEYASSSWVLAGVGSFAQAPVGQAADLWTIDAAGNIWRSNDGGGIWWQDQTYAGAVKQISACADGSIWVLDEDGATSLAASWQRIMRPTGMPGFKDAAITEVAAGQDNNGVRFVFAVANGTLLYTYELAHHAWPEWSMLGPSSGAIASIRLTRQQDTGALIVYAPPVEGAINYGMRVAGQKYQFELSSTSAWSYDILNNATPIVTSDLELSAVDSSNWFWFAAYEGMLISAVMPGNSPGGVFFTHSGQPEMGAVAQTVPLPWARTASAPFCAILDYNAQLWIAAPQIPAWPMPYGSATFLPLTGQNTAIPDGTTLLACLLQADMWTAPQPRIYAVASNTPAGPDPTLWMLSQTNLLLPPFNAAAWSSWTPLGDSFPNVFSGPSLLPTDTLFALDSSGSLDSLRQNPMTGVWKGGLIKRPSNSGDDMVTISTYQTEATILDGNGIPEANVAVTIFAASPVEAWVNNTLRALGPWQGVTVRTNAQGQISVKTMAHSLSAADLTFQADGLTSGIAGAQSGTTISPSQHVYGFLQQNEELPVGGGARTKLTPAVLQSLNKSITHATAKTVVSDCKQITDMPSGEASLLGVRLVRSALLGDPPGSWWSDGWDHVKHAAESIAHAIKKGVVSASIDLEKDTVKLTLYVGDKLVTTFHMAIHTVEDAVRAIEEIVKTWVADLKAFIEWLMLLLDWKNIIATQKAIRSFITSAIPVLQQKITTIESDVAATFQNINADLGFAFASIETSNPLGNYTTFGDLPSSASAGASAAPTALAVQMARLRGASQQTPGSSVHQNWFVSKVLDHITPDFLLKPIPGLDPTSFLESLDLQNTVSKIQSAAQALMNFFTDIFTSPSDFANKGIVDLLEAAKDLMLALVDLIEDLIKAFLGLIQTILAGLMDVLQGSVDIPVIGTLFKLVTGEDMNVLNLSTLMIAVPTYMIYDLVFGGLPFSGLSAELAGAPGMTAQQQWANANMALGLVNAAASALSDLITVATTPVGTDIPDIAPAISMLTNTIGLIMQVASWPDPAGFPLISNESPSAAQAAVWFSYALGWGSPLVGFGLAKYGDAQSVVKTILGAAGLISGLVGAIEGLGTVVNGAGAADLMVSPISNSLAWLLVSEIRQEIWESTDLLVDPALLIFVVDLIINLAGPILNEISANT